MNELRTIIEYAIKNGWERGLEQLMRYEGKNGATRRQSIQFFMDYNWKNPSVIIFDHDFLKAVFGEDINHTVGYQNIEYKNGIEYSGAKISPIVEWQYHAQQMVISEDPVDYVYEYVKEQTKD